MSMIEQSQGSSGTPASATIPVWHQLRWNLIGFAILLTLIPVLVVGVFVLQQTRTQTQNQVTYQLESVTTLKQTQIARWLDTSDEMMDVFLSSASASNLLVNFATEGAGGPLSAFVNAMLLTGIEAQHDDDAAFKEFFLYDLTGRVTASSDEAQVGKIVGRQPYFEASLTGEYLQYPYYDVGTNGLTMLLTRPVIANGGAIVAVIAGRLNLSTLGLFMTERSGLGDTGETYLVSIENNYLLTPSRFEGFDQNQAYRTEGIDNALNGENGSRLYLNYRNIPVLGVYRWIPELKAAFLAEIEEAEAFTLYNRTLTFGTISIIVAAIVATLIALYYATRVSRPITLLTNIASRIASGDLSQRATVHEQNELGVLASTFNSMTDQLQDFVTTLEDRVNDRTRDLQIVANVSKSATTILNLDELLQQVVDLTKDSFALYHAHIYLLEEKGEKLALATGAGEPGRLMKERGHSIPLNREQSIVARAGRERRGVIANDITAEPDFMANPLLPNTRSELAVPMVVGDRLIGVLDVQADVPNHFTPEDVRVQTSLADQIGVAVQNARAFAEIQSAQETIRANQEQLLEAQQIARLGRWVWIPATGEVTWNELMFEHFGLPTTTQPSFELFMSRVHPDDAGRLTKVIEDAFQSGATEFGSEYRVMRGDGEVRYHAAIGAITRADDGTPLRVVGTAHDITERKEVEAERQIVYEAASLLNEAHDRRHVLEAILPYAQQTGAISALLLYIEVDSTNTPQWAEVVGEWNDGSALNTPIGSRFYLPEFPISKLWMSSPNEPLLVGDLNTSTIVDEMTRSAMQQTGGQALAILPMVTQGRWAALMTISWGAAVRFTDQDRRIYRSMMRQATATVDALRAAEQTQKRAAELQIVAQVSAAATMVLDVEALLQAVTDLTKDSFDLYHAHVYLMDETGENLVLTAGAGEAGRIMKEQGRTISIQHQNSLVARAARIQDGVISNDVTQEPDFLPNPLLPDTRSEMAIPLIVADEVVGVLDVQANTTNRFDADDVAIQTTLADQIAVAVQNARAFQIQQQTAERLREVDRLKSQFLANMSHELRTPLNSIIGYAEVLLDGIDGDLSEEAVEDVQAIHGGGKHLLTIINDILDLAKIEAGQMFMDRQGANLNQAVDEVVATCLILAKNKEIALEVEMDGEVPAVYGDPIRLKQIIFNLVNNAIKFTEQGGVTVHMGVTDDQNQVVVAVRDSGIGMTQDDIAGLFQQFHQVDGSATRRAGGTGLGLVITRHLIHMHQGEIYVESEKGAGSTFWFTLPVYANQPRQKA